MMQKSDLAFHGDPDIKARYVAITRAARDAQKLVQKFYWDTATAEGCAVGVVSHDANGGHDAYAQAVGLPLNLVMVNDGIFSGQDEKVAPGYAVDFLNVIPVGADLSLVCARLLYGVMTEELPKFDDPRWPDVSEAVTEASRLYARYIAGESFSSLPYAKTLTVLERAREGVYRHSHSTESTLWYTASASIAALKALDAYTGMDSWALWEAVYAARRTTAPDYVAAKRIAEAMWNRIAIRLLTLLAAAPVPE